MGYASNSSARLDITQITTSFQLPRTFFTQNGIFTAICVFASMFHFELAGGAIIFFDFIALAIIACHFPVFLRIAKGIQLFFTLFALCLSSVLTYLIIGAAEVTFLARVTLILLDAIAFVILVKTDRSNFLSILSGATFGFFCGFIIFLAFPSLREQFYFHSLKPWIAVAPILPFIVANLSQRPILSNIFLSANFIIALFFQSRTLLVGVILAIVYRYFKAKLLIKIVGSILLIGAGYSIWQLSDLLITAQEHSNTFRSTMILQIFDFSGWEMVFGRGLDNWREVAFNDLYLLANAEIFFERANPHFFPAELVIMGGLLMLLIVGWFILRLMRNSLYWAQGSIIIVGTFFTTNTGTERLLLAIGIFIVIVGHKKFPYWRGGQRALRQMEQSYLLRGYLTIK